ncbi:MAG: hypothetical protein WC742_05035 [Gallionellaceae bacterium]|jgi:hypothetical protein
MFDSSSLSFDVASFRHRALGKLIQVRFAEDFALRLTPAEASSLSFALVAVRDGVSPEREIYMSPIASDAAFIAAVHDTGVNITLPNGKLELDWIGVGTLAESLAINIDQ